MIEVVNNYDLADGYTIVGGSSMGSVTALYTALQNVSILATFLKGLKREKFYGEGVIISLDMISLAIYEVLLYIGLATSVDRVFLALI